MTTFYSVWYIVGTTIDICMWLEVKRIRRTFASSEAGCLALMKDDTHEQPNYIAYTAYAGYVPRAFNLERVL